MEVAVVGQRSQLVFTTAGIYVIILTVLLGAALTTDGRVVTVVQERSVSPDQDSCMARWIKQANANFNQTHSNTRYTESYTESFLASLLQAVRTSSLANLQPTTVTAAFFNNRRAAEYVTRCTGTSPSSPDCVRDSPCLNGGRCVFQRTPSASRDFVCQCKSAHRGTFCQTEIDRCTSGVCGEGATCKPTSDGYVCLCPPLRTGRHCQTTWLREESFSRLARQHDILRSYVSRLVNGTSNFLNMLETRVEASMDRRLSSIQTAISAQKTNFLRLETELQNLQSSLDQQGGKVEKVRSSVLNLRGELQALNSSVQDLSGVGGGRGGGPKSPHVSQRLPPATITPVTSSYLFDSQKKGTSVTVTNHGRTAHVLSASGGAVLGETGFATGKHRWRLRASSISYHMAVGVSLMHTYLNHFYGNSVYAWWENARDSGLAAPQTAAAAKLPSWRSGDNLTLTLDCDQQLLTMHLHRTNQEKTIRMARAGEKLFLYAYMQSAELEILSYQRL